MSVVDSEHSKNYVVTYRELLFTFIVFTAILFVLYPKDLLKEQILSEKSNYDLSMLYLKNLLETEPENEALMLILAEQSLRTGKIDLSLRLLNLLLKSENKDRRHKATLLSYELKKDQYYYYKDIKEQSIAKEELRKLFMGIFIEKMYHEDEIEKWHHEAVFLNEDRARYYFLKLIIVKDASNVELLESGYYLSIKLNRPNESSKFIKLLVNHDSSQHDKWVLDEYYMLMGAKKYTRAEKLLREQSSASSVWKQRAADYYLMRQLYIKSSSLYMELFHSTKEYNLKKEYLFKAVSTLQAGNYLHRTAALGHKYEKYYLRDREVRSFLLKVYIATGNLEYASALSIKILNKKK